MFDYEGEGVGYLEMVFTSSVEDGDELLNNWLKEAELIINKNSSIKSKV